jgi:ankyrin repeat protein
MFTITRCLLTLVFVLALLSGLGLAKDKAAVDGYLFQAVKSGDPNWVKSCLARGADANWQTVRRRTILMFAAEYGNLEVVKLLIEHGADVRAKDILRETPLFYAARSGSLPVAKYLIDKGLDVNAAAAGRYGQTPLMAAAACGDFDMVNLLLEKGAKVNAKDGCGCTPLIPAVRKGYLDVVGALLGAGAHVNIRDSAGRTPLVFAAKGNKPEIVKMLLTSRPQVRLDASDVSGNTPMMEAAWAGNSETVRLLLDWGAHVDSRDRYGATPLMNAVEMGYADLAKILLNRGADVNAVGRYGRTPLMNAVEMGYADIARLLLDRGAQVNAGEQDGWTPVKAAAIRSDVRMVKLLKAAGAKAPLPITPKVGEKKEVKGLRDQGAIISEYGHERKDISHKSIRLDSQEVKLKLKKTHYVVYATFHFFNTGKATREWIGFPKRLGASQLLSATTKKDLMQRVPRLSPARLPPPRDLQSRKPPPGPPGPPPNRWLLLKAAPFTGQYNDNVSYEDFLRVAPVIEQFDMWVDSRKIDISEERGWIVQHVTFSGHEPTTIRVRYQSSYRNPQHPPGIEKKKLADYFLGTGAYWKGWIPRAVFTVDASELGGTDCLYTRLIGKSDILFGSHLYTMTVLGRLSGPGCEVRDHFLRTNRNVVRYEIRDFEPGSWFAGLVVIIDRKCVAGDVRP